MLIGISGYAQCGKDTVCGILKHHGIITDRYAFADPIKVTCNALFGWDERHAFGELKEVETQTKLSYIEVNTPAFYAMCAHYGLDRFGIPSEDILAELSSALRDGIDHDEGTLTTSPREVYQLFGTEVGRHLLDENVWVLIAPTNDTAIPDVRFPNEAEWIHSKGGQIIRVVKDDAKPVRPHESESYIETLPADLILDNNGSLAALETQIMQHFGISEAAPRLYSNTGDVDSVVSRADLIERISTLEQQLEIQSMHGNWNFDPYMHGFTNGMIYAIALMKGSTSVEFKDAPEEWMCDRHPHLPGGFELQQGAVPAATGLDCHFGEGCPNGVCDCVESDVPADSLANDAGAH